MSPRYLVSFGRHQARWLAVVYMADGDGMLPTAVVTGPLHRVNRSALALARALPAPRSDGADLDLIGAGAEPNLIA